MYRKNPTEYNQEVEAQWWYHFCKKKKKLKGLCKYLFDRSTIKI